jgi:aminoglycoside phosphotransferase family enzyme
MAQQADTAVSMQKKLKFLQSPQAYAERPRHVEVIETHMSWVFLTDSFAYKLKKPVRYDFLDFSTLEARREDCAREVRLNRRLANGVYLGIVTLKMQDKEQLALDGPGQAVDYLVHMRRLPAERMLDQAIADENVDIDKVFQVARRLAAFYKNTSVVPMRETEYCARFAADIQANQDELSKPEFQLPKELVDAVSYAQNQFVHNHARLLKERAAAGKIVDAHGDLRPQHICLVDEPVIIDCLEFNREFRLLDPVDELAYLTMECERLEAAGIGDYILKEYCTASKDNPPLELVDFYKTFRACLRAKIAVWHTADHEVRNHNHWLERAGVYLELAQKYARGI